jgi:hypothetical protein
LLRILTVKNQGSATRPAPQLRQSAPEARAQPFDRAWLIILQVRVATIIFGDSVGDLSV